MCIYAFILKKSSIKREILTKFSIVGVCLTDGIMFKLRLCFSLCLIGIITSIFQFALDVCGTIKYGLVCLRRNAVGNITSGKNCFKAMIQIMQQSEREASAPLFKGSQMQPAPLPNLPLKADNEKLNLPISPTLLSPTLHPTEQ